MDIDIGIHRQKHYQYGCMDKTMRKNNSTYMTCSEARWANKWIFCDNLPRNTYEIIA